MQTHKHMHTQHIATNTALLVYVCQNFNTKKKPPKLLAPCQVYYTPCQDITLSTITGANLLSVLLPSVCSCHVTNFWKCLKSSEVYYSFTVSASEQSVLCCDVCVSCADWRTLVSRPATLSDFHSHTHFCWHFITFSPFIVSFPGFEVVRLWTGQGPLVSRWISCYTFRPSRTFLGHHSHESWSPLQPD